MGTEYTNTDKISREDWLKLRALDVTSTEAAALYGMSPYVTELELYHRKMAGDLGEIADNDRMKAGRALEPAIAKLAGDEIGDRVLPFNQYARDPDTRMGSSFDWRITQGPYARWILEIKNVDYLIFRDNWLDDDGVQAAPDHIEVQIQHQLELTGRPGAVLAVLVGGNDLKLFFIERDEAVGRAIRARIDRFWADVEAENEPEPNWERDADFIIAMATKDGGEAYKASPLESSMIRLYMDAGEELRDLEAHRKVLKAKLLRAAGDANQIIGEGCKVGCKTVKANPGKEITPEMVGQVIGARSGFRGFRTTNMKT